MGDSQTLLEAIDLTSSSNFEAITQLLLAHPLQPELVLRILLTHLAEGAEPESYIPIIHQVRQQQQASFKQPSRQPEDTLGQTASKGLAQRLRLSPLSIDDDSFENDSDTLTQFILHQAHRIDQQTGSLDLVRRLVEPFVNHSEPLRTWAVSILLPLLRLQYDYSESGGITCDLAEFERLDEQKAFALLLARQSTAKESLQHPAGATAIRELIGPWMYAEGSRKRRRLTKSGKSTASEVENVNEEGSEQSKPKGWSRVNEWLFHQAQRDFETAVNNIKDWNGPSDVDFGTWGQEFEPMDQAREPEQDGAYSQTILATIIANNSASTEDLTNSREMLSKVCRLMKIEALPDIPDLNHPPPMTWLQGVSPRHLPQTGLLDVQNPLTSPTSASVHFLEIVIWSALKLRELGLERSCRSVIDLILFCSIEAQRAELHRILQYLKEGKLTEQSWLITRNSLLELKGSASADASSTSKIGVLCQIPQEELELEVLRGMLQAGCYRVVTNLYLKKGGPLPEEPVRKIILSTAMAHFDAATNGNRTRGQMRKAFEIVQTFKSQCSSPEFRQFEALLAATHSMSFYALILQQGVPFLPVNVRAHKRPTDLIERILQQNPRSYTHLDDLLEIGQNLVTAGLEDSEQDHNAIGLDDEGVLEFQRLRMRRMVTRMAIEAALAEDDFDTAYSYVVNRLHQEARAAAGKEMPGQYDDISWRAAYAAGRYPTSHDGTSALRRIEQRMELLSQALLLAPPSALSELLAVWQTCEHNLNELLAQDAAQDDAFDQQWDHHIPGGFSEDSAPQSQRSRVQMKSSLQEEAPMGLFDAAREVGAALGKSAFPLRGLQRGSMDSSDARAREQDSEDADGMDGANRVRKRDMVSNMVAGGLASGIGWVIGAPPVRD